MSSPSQNESIWTKWATIGTVAAAIIAFVALYKTDPGINIINNVSGQQQQQQTPPPNTTKIIYRPIHAESHEKESSKPEANPVKDPENLWDGQVANKIRGILSQKGYNGDMKTSGDLILSGPEIQSEKDHRYTLTLTVHFFAPSAKQSCGELVYRSIVKTDSKDHKDRIITQGLESYDGILAQMEKETNFPACLSK